MSQALNQIKALDAMIDQQNPKYNHLGVVIELMIEESDSIEKIFGCDLLTHGLQARLTIEAAGMVCCRGQGIIDIHESLFA